MGDGKFEVDELECATAYDYASRFDGLTAEDLYRRAVDSIAFRAKCAMRLDRAGNAMAATRMRVVVADMLLIMNEVFDVPDCYVMRCVDRALESAGETGGMK